MAPLRFFAIICNFFREIETFNFNLKKTIGCKKLCFILEIKKYIISFNLGSPYGPLAGEIERHERERERERLMAAAAGGSPRTPFAPPNAPGTPGPPPGGNPFLPPMHGHDQRGRQLEELMRASANAAEAERVYNHR